MSYRYYIGKMKRSEYLKISECKTKKEISELLNLEYDEKENYLYVADITSEHEIDQIGDEVFKINKSKKINKFFKSDELNEFYNDGYDLFRMNKNDLISLIEIYEKINIDFYKRKMEDIKELIEIGEKDEALEKSEYYFNSKIKDWKRGVVDKNVNNKDRVNSSYLYEYSIFDLVYLLKNTNWKTEIVFVRGS